jgi:hypothetical protein
VAVKALRMTEEEFAAARKRIGKAQHNSGWPFPKDDQATRRAKLLLKVAQTTSPAPVEHKYHAKPVDGYHSTSEAKRARELQMLEKAGAIANLREQVPFLLIPAHNDPNPDLRERACSYEADFVYEEAGTLVVEDCKGYRAGTAYALYVVKRKLMLHVHGIKIRETGR